MKSNLTLIGMPGAGKSTVGIIVAKNLAMGFIDTDVLIQINHQKPLQRILEESGHLALRSVEENEILKLKIENHVVATGGSAVYSATAMAHLRRISTIIFLEADFEIIKRRIHNFDTRGIAKADNQSFRELFNERASLYRNYADVIVDCNRSDQETVAARIAKSLRTEPKIPGKHAT